MTIDMNVDVILEGNSIKDHVVSYHRENKICTAIGTLDLVLSGDFSTSILPWDEIQIYEDGDLVNTYYVNSVSRNAPDYDFTVSAQDASKKLVDYFIPEVYTIDYASNSLYWIEIFLEEAGIPFVAEEGTAGVLLNNPTALGHITAYDQIIELLQMSGLFLTFGSDGTAYIGKITKDLSVLDDYIDDTDIISIKVNKDDKDLRNRAVVWGSGNPLDKSWIFADVRVTTPWNYSDSDSRAIVMSNGSIFDTYNAYNLANLMINEFARLTITKTVEVIGTRGVQLGDIIYIDSNQYSGSGLITSLSVDMSSKGLISTITLDERCPRLFGYFDLLDDVYAGTQTAGVWRKKILGEPQTWENFSTGLADLGVVDLYKNNCLLSCVTISGLLYERNQYAAAWTHVPLVNFPVTISGTGTEIIADGIMARAVTQDRYTNMIHVVCDTNPNINNRDNIIDTSGIMGISISGEVIEDIHCWVAEVSPYTGTVTATHQVIISGFDNVVGVDIDNNGLNDFVSVAGLFDWGWGGADGVDFYVDYFRDEYKVYHDVHESHTLYYYHANSDYPEDNVGDITNTIYINVLNPDPEIEITYTMKATPQNSSGDYYSFPTGSIVLTDMTEGMWWDWKNIDFGRDVPPPLNDTIVYKYIIGKHSQRTWRLDTSIYYNLYSRSGGDWSVDIEINSRSGSGGFVLTPNNFVLKRTGNDFEVVESGADHFRVDLSQYDPLLVITSGLNSLDVVETRNLVHHPSAASSVVTINDFRYSNFIPEELTDNNMYKRMIYTVSGNLQSFDITDLGNIDQVNPVLEYNINSGILAKVEATNHRFPSQYVFVSSEGTDKEVTSSFFQSDPTVSGLFIERNDGLPGTSINIIRTDDLL